MKRSLFAQNSFCSGALRLRRWDDLAKVPALEVPAAAHYAATLRASLKF